MGLAVPAYDNPIRAVNATLTRSAIPSACFKKREMGGGNGQKSKTARERNLEKNKPTKGSQLESNKKAMNIQCKVCMQTFICTTSEVKCREHAEAKHPKNDVYQCFPHLKN
ncbi:hypothetical protein ZIOFF_072186 [Zingiber officinale]|uniref:Uncharacterized protein n=2 Tax=Zingiber officinale TaxID=94328 RepID=A0A8J5EUR4_ZINOF|nr:hypothetical protein ZIOFF_072186 [Zingiber officinale]